MNDDPLLLISLAFDILNSNVCSCTLDIDTGLLSINHHINADVRFYIFHLYVGMWAIRAWFT